MMVEKPISAHKADAERLLACAARHPDRVLAGMFQQRVEPRYARIRNLLGRVEGRTIQRVTWINTDWFRTDTLPFQRRMACDVERRGAECW